MNFNQGDHVVHHNFGVGVIASIEGNSFPGNQPSLYYRIDFNRTTVWVPLNDQPQVGLRPITPRNELDRYRDTLKSPPVALNRDFRKRQTDLLKRSEAGTFQGLCEIFRDLHAQEAEKPLNNYERTLYQQTRGALVGEWSAASGLSQAEAQHEIEGYLVQGKLSSLHD